MSKKKRKADKRTRPKHVPRSKRRNQPPRGVGKPLRIGPFEFMQDGSTLVGRNPMSPEQTVSYALARKQAIPGEANCLRSEVVDALAPFDPVDIVAMTWFIAQLHPDVGADRAGQISEYIALICAERAPQQASLDPASIQPLIEALLSELPKVRRLVDLTIELRIMSKVSKGGTPSPHDEIEMRRFLVDLAMRMPSYWHQQEATLRDIFNDKALIDEVEARLGFTPDEAMRVIDFLADAVPKASSDALEAVRQHEPEVMEAIREARRGGSPNANGGEFIQLLATLPPAKAREQARWALIHWGAFRAAFDVTYDAQAVAKECGVQPDRVRAVVDALSVDAPIAAAKTPFFPVHHPFLGRPLLRGADDRFVCAAPANLTSCLRPLLEESLAGGPLWNRYDDRRSSYLEDRAISQLRDTLRPQRCIQNVTFEFINDQGVRENGEADGILVLDSALLLVEAKAGSTDKRRRSIKGDTRALLAEAVGQAERARRAMDAGATFHAGNGETLAPGDLHSIEHIFPIVVTLENLAWVAPDVGKAIAAGLIGEPVEMPWAVNVHDLELICELIDVPAELLYYLAERRRVEEAEVAAFDELDLFMIYLERGIPWLLRQAARGTHFVVPDWTQQHMDFVMARAAGKPHRNPPRHKIAGKLRKAIQRLDAERPTGFLNQSFAELNQRR